VVLSRRALIGGAGAAAAVGAIGVVAVGPKAVLHRVGLDVSPDHRVPASGWTIVEHRIDSRAMARSVDWAMCEPPGGAKGVVVCLHGRNDDHRAAFDSIHVHDVAADLGYPLAIASVDGGADSYWHPRADGTDALTLVLEELLPAIDASLGAELPRAILGWSMGGYGALLVAEHAPAAFTAVAAASPALWLSSDEFSPGAFDGPEDFEAFDVFTGSAKLAGLAVRVDCGTSDGFVHAARRFAEQLPEPNLGSFSAGYHDAPYWRSIVPAQLGTIAHSFGF
jgi:pimeloyl-ACP methyl ester carboxylesterase